MRRVDASLRRDFFRVHGAEQGADWCFCVAWWVPTWDGWGARTAGDNRALREELFQRGEYDGYLLYDDEEPIGWCQVGLRDRLAKLVEQFGLAPDGDVWAITCFHIHPDRRRRGLATELLRGVLADLQRRGVARVQAFPRRGVDAPGELWTGPESMYTAAGFSPTSDDPKRPVLEIRL